MFNQTLLRISNLNPNSKKEGPFHIAKKVNAMCLTVDGHLLITGDKGGLIYIWSATSPSGTVIGIDEKENGLMCTYELHRDQGQINNLLQ